MNQARDQSGEATQEIKEGFEARSLIPFSQETKKQLSGAGIPVPVRNSDYFWRKTANFGAARNS